MDRETWLAERRTGIGSSDAAAVCGISPWRTALEVYLDKIGQAEPRSSAAMEWGLRLEPALAQAYTEQTGRPCEMVPNMLRHPKLPWMLATLDRVADGRIIELKTASSWAADDWGEPGTDEIPESYIVQVQHQMAVSFGVGRGYAAADVAVLIGGQDFRIYTVEANRELQERLIEIEAAFWERVQRRDPPPPDWSHSSTPDLVAALHPITEETIELGNDAAERVAEDQRLKAEIDRLTHDRTTNRARLLYLMGAAGKATLADGTTLTRKLVTRKAYSVAESTYTDFRIQKPRKVAARTR